MPVHPAFDIGYRLVAITLCGYGGRQVWNGLIERKITSVSDDLLDWSRQVFYRDTTPIGYWMQIGGTAFTSLLCLVAAIVGWWQPSG